MYKIIIFLYLSLLITSSFGQDNVITMKRSTDLFKVGKQVYFLEDKTGELSLKQIQKADKEGKFKLYHKDIFTHKATNSAFWFKFQTKNESETDSWLAINTTFLWEIDFYTPKDSLQNNYQVVQTGVLRPLQNKPYPTTKFWIPLQKVTNKQAQTFYFRIHTGQTIEVPLVIGSLQSLSQEKTISDYLTAGFVGALLIMFLYNSFLGIATRKHIYAYYIIYLFGVCLAATFINGYPFWVDIFDSFSIRHWIYTHTISWIAPIQISVGLITINYLGLRQKHKSFYYFIVIVLILIFMWGILNLFIPTYKIQFLHQVLLLSNTIITLSISYWLTFKGKKQALFYVVGWTCMFASIVVYLCTINGWLEYTIYTRNIIYFGILLEIWFFSLALSEHISNLRKENKKVVQNLLIKAEKEIEMRSQIIDNQKQLDQANTNSLKLEIANQERMILRSIIDNLPIFVAMIDKDGNYIIANKMYEDNFFLPVSHIEGSHYTKVLPNKLTKIHNGYINKAIAGNIVEFTDPMKLPSGKMTYSYGKYFPVFDEDKSLKYVTVFVTDVSDLKYKELELQKLNDTKDKLFSIISHDLRSPFAQLKGVLDLFEKGGISEAELKYFLPEITKNVNYTSDLLNNLVYWAKSQMSGLHADPEDFDIYKLIANKENLFAKEITAKDLTFMNNVQQNTFVYADKNMTDLVIRNLVANAIKFCKKSDTILVKSEETSNDFLIVRVVDTGIGISPKNKKKIFNEENFTTLGTHKEKGTGIGLKLCKEFIEGNGGKIWIDSEEGKGTIFSFSLPTKAK
ncbi:7TM diverse intracellular signaling domain-containing protein [Bernardetia sp. ABR2-2B]|uniref:7TM diverse intracellular signaling domain-containing protein n=1 Tax=Bernardetia sp. ABR2-2B TaxID=3127472 RepID=UPI0030D072FB